MSVNRDSGTKFYQKHETERVIIVRRTGVPFEIRDIDDTIIVEKEKN